MSFDDDRNDSDYEDAKPFSLANILFGNIDEDGQLEGDYLDPDAKRHLGSLVKSTRTLHSLTNEIRDTNEEDQEIGGSSSGNDLEDRDGIVASPTAVDYYDTEDVADEDRYDEEDVVETRETRETSPLAVSLPSSQSQDSSESGFFETSGLSSYPSSQEEPVKTASEAVHALVDKVCEIDEPPKTSSAEEPSIDQASPEDAITAAAVASILEDTPSHSSLNTPLASVLPPELANIKINDIFPEFQPDVVLRFSRLFGPGRPSSLPKRWNSYRRKGDALSPGVPAEDEEEENEKEKLERLCQEHWPISLPKPVGKLPTEVVPDVPVMVENVVEGPVENREVEKPKRLTAAAIPPWRYGPAQHWYDALNVDPTGENFDYGASSRKSDSRPPSTAFSGTKVNCKLDVNDEAFLMVSLTNWEQNIIWDGALFKRDVDKLLSEKRTEAGWIPNTTYRTAASFLSHKSVSGQATPSLDLKKESMFPAVNEDLVSGNWEKQIIWDADNIEDLPEPAVLTLDPNDPNIILEIPDEEECETMVQEPVVVQTKEKKDMLKRSRMVLGKAGIIKEPESPKSFEEPKNQFKDPFNLSNDEYYTLQKDEGPLKPTTGAMAIQHSIPSMQLYQYFFPTNLNLSKNRQFHRTALKKYSNGIIIMPGPHPVESLNKNIKKKEKQRIQELAASGGGDMFFMRTPEDLSAQDGELILAEYTEEYPPLISQIGMATRIKNYYKRRPGKNEEDMPKFDYGEIALAYTSPFLGDLDVGQCVPTFENNMFRAPIYQHTTPVTDFLVVRTRNRYYIRDIRVTFTVGQECPLMEVPAPNSKKATNFARDFLQVHIYRLFWKNPETPKRIKADEVKKLFVTSSESSVRKRLKICSTSQRSGADSCWWILKHDFRLPSEEEIRALVTCEDYCAYYSMRSAEQRLKDAGYGEKLILATEDDGDEEQQSKMDDEIKAAPWNTTRAFIAAMKNKCILQVTGDADPTGRGEGFSYVRIANKIQEKDGPAPTKRIVTGTNADLRKLSLNNAKQLLRKYGCHDDQIKKLTRWEIIDLVRTLGTQQARAGNEEEMSKFARGSRYSAAEQQEKYKEDCQRIFKLQNRVLSSEEMLSTDEESSEEEDDSDIEELGRNLDSFIQSKKTGKELLIEREVEERKELKKLLSKEEAEATVVQKKKQGKKKGAAEEEVEKEDGPPQPVRKLKIVRTFRDADGRDFDRTEYVSRAALIDAYVRLRKNPDENFVRQFAALDSEKKDGMRKEKRRLQEQLRRIKHMETADEMDATTSDGTAGNVPTKKSKKERESKVRCGACGGVGHMRTNKVCPRAGEFFNVAMTKEQEDLQFGNAIEESGLVKVEGAKITLKKEVLNQTEMIRKKALIVKIPKTLADSRDLDKIESKEARKERKEREKAEGGGKRKRKESMPDYLEKPRLTTARRRIDPVVSLSSMLEDILNEIRDQPGCDDFRTPVSSKKNPYYLTKISAPMDLSTMRNKLNAGQYKSREDFLSDVGLIVTNCATYNGPDHILTVNARKMLDTCLQRFGEREERFKKLEKLINPLLDEDDQVALNYLFQQITETRLKTVDKSIIFHTPVNRTRNKEYYEFIKNPMDLDTMLQKAKANTYRTMEQFLADVELIYKNCVQYNGEASEYTRVAEDIVRVAKRAVEEEAARVAGLDPLGRDRDSVMDAADTESVGTESEGRETKKSDRMSFFGDTEDSTRASAMSDAGEDEVMQDTETPASPDGATSDMFNTSYRPEEMDDDETGSRVTDTPSSPVPKKPLRLSMVSSYYEDARTGYDDESDHGETLMDTDDKGSKEDDKSLQPSTSAPVAVETLAKDLDVSDSESEGGKAEKNVSSHTEEDDDGLWF